MKPGKTEAQLLNVMAGLVPAIHVFGVAKLKDVDAGIKPGKTEAQPRNVMAGLVPAIHVFGVAKLKDVDARHKAGQDRGTASQRHGRTRSGHPRLWRCKAERRGCPA